MTRSKNANVEIKSALEIALERLDASKLVGVKLGVGRVQSPSEDRRFKSNKSLPSLTKSERRAIRKARAIALEALEASKKETKTRRATRSAKQAIAS